MLVRFLAVFKKSKIGAQCIQPWPCTGILSHVQWALKWSCRQLQTDFKMPRRLLNTPIDICFFYQFNPRQLILWENQVSVYMKLQTKIFCCCCFGILDGWNNEEEGKLPCVDHGLLYLPGIRKKKKISGKPWRIKSTGVC